jgi:hypothetical protein
LGRSLKPIGFLFGFTLAYFWTVEVFLALGLFSSSSSRIFGGSKCFSPYAFEVELAIFENFSENSIPQPFNSIGPIYIQALLQSRLVSIFGSKTVCLGKDLNKV